MQIFLNTKYWIDEKNFQMLKKPNIMLGLERLGHR